MDVTNFTIGEERVTAPELGKAIKNRRFNREILCSYSILEKIKARYPNRKVIPDHHAMSGAFYFFSGRDGSVRIVHDDGSIWGCDYGMGYPWIKKLRGRK